MRAITVLVCVALASASICLCGCLGLSTKVRVAATVNDIVIDEADVTAYIEGFRDEDDSRETDAGWAQYLRDKGYTAETLRAFVLNSVFIPDAMVAIEAGKRDIVVTDEELDELIASEKEYYESKYGADTWDGVLSSAGYDETSWRKKETTRLLKEQLCETVVGDVTLTDSQIQAHAGDVIANYNGKHSYFIAFNSKENAEAALSTLGGEGALIAKSKFRRVGKTYQSASDAHFEAEEGAETPRYTQSDGMVNAGWSSLPNYAQSQSAIYTNALNALPEDSVSGVVDLENGTWVLIFCDEAYVAEDNDILNLDQIPTAIYEQVCLDVANIVRDEQFDDWLSSATKKATVVINDMPDNLPYNVNVPTE